MKAACRSIRVYAERLSVASDRLICHDVATGLSLSLLLSEGAAGNRSLAVRDNDLARKSRSIPLSQR
ncbi:hypothetical protein BFO_1387 [Tannerella forsythia 92A2]|uniref:Uncharacterized protein n=1 Tax=Tannerella forsythia (strain ATCC 43037 / JCM 10827 / CCUG 21028 A / KCTC 5666 / FDC 338) TaxID=203275 RepID=G8UKJ7_TANFA|nr:hypothetical protein BFO_1387 [Tannerella forsythia 92A2]BAR48798.1 hypothetical protein TF3313_1268 [Tannerella forsythia 3313]